MVRNMSIFVVIIHMVIIRMSRKTTIYLGKVHNKNIEGQSYTYRLFCLVLQFCDAHKQLARTTFVLKVHFRHILKEID